jgi:2-iminobutanoate/2-iminopropanoate deaminase
VNHKKAVGYPGIPVDEKRFGPAPLSPAIVAGSLLFISGQVGMDPTTGKVVASDVAGQTRQTLANMKAILQGQGLAMDDLVKVNVFLTDVADFAAMNAVYREFFTEPYPARSTVGIRLANEALLVEIEGVAQFR